MAEDVEHVIYGISSQSDKGILQFNELYSWLQFQQHILLLEVYDLSNKLSLVSNPGNKFCTNK